MNFSEKIRNARLAKGLSQDDLAKAAGISLRTVQNYELGARLPKKKDTYTSLAKALGIHEEVLLDENASFVIRANEQYGSRGARQAWDMAAEIGSMWAERWKRKIWMPLCRPCRRLTGMLKKATGSM